MKKAVKILAFTLLFSLIFTICVSAEEDIYKEQFEQSGADEIINYLSDNAKDIIVELDIDPSDSGWVNKLTPESVFKMVSSFFKEGLKKPLSCGMAMFAVIILLAAANTFEGFKIYNDLSSFVFVLITAAGILLPLFSVIESAANAVKGISTLMIGFVPLFAGILTISGGAVTASGMSFLLLAAAGAVGNISSFIIVPLMSCYLGVGMAGSVMPIGTTNRLGEGIKSIAMWVLSLSMTLFLGLLSVQTAVNRAADNLGIKTLKFMIGTFVPVAGGALSDSFTTLLGSVKLLKTSVAMFAALGIAIMVLPIIIELLIWRVTIYFLNLSLDLFGLNLKTDVLKSADCVLAVLIGVILFVSTLFIISLAVISGGSS